MLRSLCVLFACQFAGDWLQHLTGLPIPGPILGMLMLLGILLIRGSVETRLIEDGQRLLRYLPLFFVPAGVGLLKVTDVLKAEWLPILVSLVFGTLVAFVVTAKTMDWLLLRFERKSQD